MSRPRPSPYWRKSGNSKNKRLIPTADIVLEPGRLVFARHFDVGPAREELGYRNCLSFEEGIKASINAVRGERGLAAIA